MATHFERQLEELHVQIITMGSLCEKVISLSNRALRGDKCIQEIFDTDKEIDTKEREIENLCMRILLHQQPVARDLREVSAALKMISDMERIGDHAADISEMTIYMSNGAEKPDLTDIRKMAKETVVMLNWSVEAYVEKDIEKAKQVIKHDDIVDDLFDTVKKDIIKMILSENKDGEQATDLLMVAKYFERIGDHATNIAEWVMFSMKSSE